VTLQAPWLPKQRWRGVNAPHLVPLVRAGATLINGKLVRKSARIGSTTRVKAAWITRSATYAVDLQRGLPTVCCIRLRIDHQPQTAVTHYTPAPIHQI
jgi:hypothetical protein